MSGVLCAISSATVAMQLPGVCLEEWRSGHGDVNVSYVEGEWEWKVRGEVPERVSVLIGPNARLSIPDRSDFRFLGNPGDPVWVAPQVQQEEVPFIGIASDSQVGALKNDRFDLVLSSVEGPGEVAMWTTGTSEVTVLMNSGDGIGAADRVRVPATGHVHLNWGFTSPGTYEVGLRAEGVLADGSKVVSEPRRVSFEVSLLKDGEVEVVEPIFIHDGEVDFAIGYDASRGWAFSYHHHGGEENHDHEVDGNNGHSGGAEEENNGEALCVDSAVLQVEPGSRQAVPDDPALSFLGAVGEPVYIVPQAETEGLLYLGISTEAVESGVFESDELRVRLDGVEGPGNLFLYSLDAFGEADLVFDSSDGVAESDVLPMKAGQHLHQNWAFTQPGVYRVTLTAGGESVDGTKKESDRVTLTFDIQEAARSRLSISSRGPDEVTLTWRSVSNIDYQVLTTTDLSQGKWEIETTVSGTGEPLSLVVPIEGTARFFALRVIENR